jgi:hypothetical protein
VFTARHRTAVGVGCRSSRTRHASGGVLYVTFSGTVDREMGFSDEMMNKKTTAADIMAGDVDGESSTNGFESHLGSALENTPCQSRSAKKQDRASALLLRLKNGR